MDNLSSSELDSPSKTPLFIAIAAVIVAFFALGLAWMGFSRASALEAKLVSLGDASERMVELETAVSEQGARVNQLVTNINTLSQEVSRVLGEVEGDISKLKKDVRSVAIEAGTAKRMVEDLEEKGVKVAAPTAVAPIQEGTGSDTPPTSEAGGVYTIKSGDTLGKIAAAYKVSLSQLQTANPGIDARRLRIGQQIVIPAEN